ncbi:MAG: septum formation protein Maf [Bacilli bacterium]|nr:septum formation protein Maf [Bacilli bacterium]
MKYVLASKSPRRQELMKIISSDFIVATEDIDEESSYKLSPIKAVEDIARRKGEAVEKYYPEDLIISADTIVVLDNQIIGKPIDELDAKRILKELSGKAHYVHTGFRIKYLNKEIISHVTSEVIFNELSDELINKYVKSGSPLDKAGAYGVQDNGKFPIIKKVIGSVDNVVGFPVKEIKELIEQIKK